MTVRNGYSRLQKSVYLVPVVIADGDFPMQSSTNTLTVRVCSCDRNGNTKQCNSEAFTLAAGLSTGALVAILLCVIILLGKNTSLCFITFYDSVCDITLFYYYILNFYHFMLNHHY